MYGDQKGSRLDWSVICPARIQSGYDTDRQHEIAVRDTEHT